MISILSILLGFAACGKPSVEMVFNTSTESYPVTTDEDAAALASLGASASGMSVQSVLRIQMQGIADAKMESVHLLDLVLIAKEGDLRFLQLAKCYVQSRSAGGKPVLVGTAHGDSVSADGKSVKFEANSGHELSEILRKPFQIVVEIEGDNPAGKVSVSAELKFKARVVF